MRFSTMSVLAAMLAMSMTANATPVVSDAGNTASARGDEATINSHAMDLNVRIRAAERSGAMSHAEASRHRRALARMVESAKADLRRPPHFISATKNAVYDRTVAAVDRALTRSERRP